MNVKMKTAAKVVSVVLASALIAVGLAACGSTADSIEKDAKLAKACVNNGGEVYYNMYNTMYCTFDNLGEEKD